MKKWLPVVALACALAAIGLYLHFNPSRPAENSAETISSAIAKSNSVPAGRANCRSAKFNYFFRRN